MHDLYVSQVYITSVHSADIIDEIRACNKPPFRPALAENVCSPGMHSLISSCLEENPAQRPDFVAIRKVCSKLGM